MSFTIIMFPNATYCIHKFMVAQFELWVITLEYFTKEDGSKTFAHIELSGFWFFFSALMSFQHNFFLK